MKKTNTKDNVPSKKNVIIRLILFILFFAVGIGFIVNGVSLIINVSDGWVSIEYSGDTTKPNIEGEVSFKVYFDENDDKDYKNDIYKQIKTTYNTYCVKAYEMFDPLSSYEDTINLNYLNNHLGEEVELEPFLYDSLVKCVENDFDYIFYGPIIEYYDGIFTSNSSQYAKYYDPYYESEVQTIIDTITNYIKTGAVKLELNDGKAKLTITNEYKEYLSGYSLGNYIDFGFTKYAFYVDLLAKTLEANSIYNYSINTIHGFYRYNTKKSVAKEFNFFDLKNGTVSQFGYTYLTTETNIINYRIYPLSSNEYDYFTYDKDHIANSIIDLDTGYYKQTNDNLYLLNHSSSIADLLIKTYSKYSKTIDVNDYLEYEYIYINDSEYKLYSNINDKINLISIEDTTYTK